MTSGKASVIGRAAAPNTRGLRSGRAGWRGIDQIHKNDGDMSNLVCPPAFLSERSVSLPIETHYICIRAQNDVFRQTTIESAPRPLPCPFPCPCPSSPAYLRDLRAAHLHAAARGRKPLLPLRQVRQRQQHTIDPPHAAAAASAAAEPSGLNLSHVPVRDRIITGGGGGGGAAAAAAPAGRRALSRPRSSPSSLLPPPPPSQRLPSAGLLLLLLRHRQPVNAGAPERPS